MGKARQQHRDRILKALGAAVRCHRLHLQLSQEELGARANLHRTYITDIENGLRNLSFLTLVKVTGALELAPSQLMSLAENVDSWPPTHKTRSESC